MYNFSGLLYRVWAVGGFILLIGSVIILLKKPWAATFKLKDCKYGILLIVVAIGLSVYYVSGVFFPNVQVYTGEFVDCHRNSRVAPPLPLTYQYDFSNEKMNPRFFLDAFSKKNIFPKEFESGKVYTIYYDKRTRVIVKVDEIE